MRQAIFPIRYGRPVGLSSGDGTRVTFGVTDPLLKTGGGGKHIILTVFILMTPCEISMASFFDNIFSFWRTYRCPMKSST